MGDETFRAQNANLLYGWQTVAQAARSDWLPSTSIDRNPRVFENIGLTAAVGKVDRTATISGLTGAISGPRAVLTPQGTFLTPLTLGKFELGLLAHVAGATKTQVQLGADTAFTQVIDPDQTDVEVLDRWLTFLYDKKDKEIQLWHPCGVKQVDLNFAKAEVAMMETTLMSLGFGFYDVAAVVAGSATFPVVIRGWLNAANRALADKKLFIKVTAYADPAATVLAGFAVTPVGAESFAVTAGLDAEGRPQWAEVIDGDSATPGQPIGTADNKLEMALLDETDVTVLDEYSYENQIASSVKVNPGQPEMVVSAVCLFADGDLVADLEGVSLSIVSDLGITEGGACRAFPTAFKRTGTSTVTGEFERGWITYRHMGDLRDDAKFVLQITARSDQQIDTGGARSDQYNFTIDIPIATFADGQEFKTLSGGSEDDTETITFMGEPDGSNPSWRFSCDTDVSDIYG